MFSAMPATVAVACVRMKRRKIGEMTATDSRTPRRFKIVSAARSPNVNGRYAKWSEGGTRLKIDSEHAASEIATVST